jgi:hypothetical protein
LISIKPVVNLVWLGTGDGKSARLVFPGLDGGINNMAGKRASLAALAVISMTTASCTSLPDTSAYTAATLELKQSAAAAGSVLSSELTRTAAEIPGDQNRAALAAAATKFDAAWQDTVGSLAAMGRYAESVEDLTNAGNHGSQSAQALSESVLSLASGVGFVPGAAVAGAAVETFKLLNSAVANIRASRSLAASLAAADPIMQDIGREVGGQVTLAQSAFTALISQQRADIDIAFSDVRDVDSALRDAELAAARRAVGAAGDSGLQEEITRLRDTRALMAPRVAEYQAALHELAARERAGRDLFVATQSALQTWSESHSRLVRAIRERRPVSFQSLQAASQEVRGLIQRWRDL